MPAILCLLVFCYAMWGGGMIAMKFALASFSVNQVVSARVAFAAAFYLLLLPSWRKIPYQKGDWKYLCALVVFEPCLFFMFETFSMRYTTASQGGVIAACFPVCTAILAWIFLGEKMGKVAMGAIVLAVVGVAGSSWFASGDSRAPNPLLGNMLMFGAVLSSSAYAVCARYITRRYSFLAVSAVQAIGGTVAFLPLLLFEDWPVTVTPDAWGGLLYMGIGVGIMVYLCFNFALQRLKAGLVALFGNLIPIFTLLFARLILHEEINLPQLAFIGLTITGVIIAGLAGGEKEA